MDVLLDVFQISVKYVSLCLVTFVVKIFRNAYLVPKVLLYRDLMGKTDIFFQSFREAYPVLQLAAVHFLPIIIVNNFHFATLNSQTLYYKNKHTFYTVKVPANFNFTLFYKVFSIF